MIYIYIYIYIIQGGYLPLPYRYYVVTSGCREVIIKNTPQYRCSLCASPTKTAMGAVRYSIQDGNGTTGKRGNVVTFLTSQSMHR